MPVSSTEIVILGGKLCDNPLESLGCGVILDVDQMALSEVVSASENSMLKSFLTSQSIMVSQHQMLAIIARPLTYSVLQPIIYRHTDREILVLDTIFE